MKTFRRERIGKAPMRLHRYCRCKGIGHRSSTEIAARFPGERPKVLGASHRSATARR